MENQDLSLMTVDELCERLMICKNAAYRLLGSQKIKAFRIGKTWKIPRENVDKYILAQCQ